MGRRDGHGHAFYAKSHCLALRNGLICEPCEDALERKRMMASILPADVLRPFVPKPPISGRTSWDQMGGVKFTLSQTVQKILYRALADGFLSYAQADTLAIALGRHPAEIWGWTWYGFEETA